MGEARRRVQQGLPPRQKKNITNDSSPKMVSWLPITQRQKDQFFKLTITGGWIGITLLVLVWITVRFIGPAAGWWTPADLS